MHIATLLAARGLDDTLLSALARGFDGLGRLRRAEWLDAGEAADLAFEPPAGSPGPAWLAAAIRERALALAERDVPLDVPLDVVVQPAAGRAKRLLVADMDSTMITVECIDELADYAGVKPQVAAVTEAAMRGELDFAGALDARVALLAGLDAVVIDRCLAERVRPMAGAAALVATMRARGAVCVLVSGGFTRFAEPVAARLGFTRAVANVLEVADGRLTGRVARPLVDAAAKRAVLEAERAALGLDRAQVLAVGDGANDLAMLGAAGLGVAYRAKPVVAAAADARIEHGDLTALLWAQGLARREWAVG